jgi:hypothetical protein
VIPISILEQVNKYLRHCFWRKYGMDDKGTALIASQKACKPKNQGGLGIVDVATHNKVLMMKNLHKFFNKADLSRVKMIWGTYNSTLPAGKLEGSPWWKTRIKLIGTYKQVVTSIVENGATTTYYGMVFGMVLHSHNNCHNFSPSITIIRSQYKHV